MTSPRQDSAHTDHATSNDAATIRQIADGDDMALASLYDRWAQPVYSLVLHLLGNSDEAEDVVEQAFWQIRQRASSYDSTRESARAWILAIGRERALDKLRNRRRRGEKLSNDAGPRHDFILDPSLESEEARRGELMAAAVDDLPADQRRVIGLAYARALSQAEIADVLGEPIGIVKTTMRLGMHALRERIFGPAEERDPNAGVDLAGAALGALSPDEESGVRTAVASDPALASELARMRELVAELGRLTLREPINRGRSAGIRSRLVTRAVGMHAGRATTIHPVVPVGAAARAEQGVEEGGASEAPGAKGQESVRIPRRGAPIRSEPRSFMDGFVGQNRFGWLALIALVALLVTAVELWRVSRQNRQETIAVSSQTTTLMDSLSQLRAEVVAKDSAMAAMVGPSTRVIDLGSYSSVNPVARMFWDQKTQMWTLYASRVKQPPDGKIYQVWLIARGHSDPISAGTFSPDSTGSAVARARYGLEPGTLRRIVVTEERAGGARYPTGPIVFAGNGR